MSLSDFETILNAAPLPQIIVGPSERILAANAQAVDLLGAGVVSRHYITGVRQPYLLDCIETVLTGKLDRAETQFMATEATKETTYRVVVGAFNVDGERGVLVSFLDTTDLQEAGQMRRDFVANVSHEMRTPLTALLGFIETLRGAAREDPAARDRFLEIMEREAGRMNRLVHDLLSLSRVESEERVRPQANVDLSKLVESVTATLRPVADDAGIAIELAGADIPNEVPGDEDQLSQVVSNLVENAIKYGSKGTVVTVTLQQAEEQPAIRGRAIILTVADNGEGFDPVHIPRLTERFYRVDNHRSREMGGTGLGLAIVKHVVNRHRGRLRIESEPGEGSRFSVVIPAA